MGCFSGARAGGRIRVAGGIAAWSPRRPFDPFFFGHDEAVFLRRRGFHGTPAEQFFRAIAIHKFSRDLHQISTRSAELLKKRPDVAPVKMLLVYLENGSIRAALLGRRMPLEPVMAKQYPTS